MRTMLVGALLAAAVVAIAAPVDAGALNALFDLSFRIGERGITLGGRVDGPSGPSSGEVTGRLKPGGVTVDGWVDDRGQTWLFELDASVLDGAMRAVVRRSPMRI